MSIEGFIFKRRSFIDWKFDSQYSVDTSGTFDVADASPDSNPYAATPPYRFYSMLSNLPFDPKEFTFVDYGCGKGRVLIMASEVGFKRIIGLEFSRALTEIAKKNVESYEKTHNTSSRIEAVCIDTTSFPIPSGKTLLYFYNPFKEDLMRAVLSNVEHALEDASKEMWIVYYNPCCGQLLDTAAFLSRVRTRRQSSVYRSVPRISST